LNILGPEKLESGEAVYPTKAAEFVLSVIQVSATVPFRSARNRSMEIMMCTEGEARVTDLSDGEITLLTKGTSIIVPAAVEQYSIEGDGILYKAAVPLAGD
jgi:mannose-6-phosphate isomerase